MESYLSEAACRGIHPRIMQECTLKTRRFLVGKLLSAREDPRLLVAPTGFGKSFLAGQYASLIFSFWHVFWFDCQDLRFLRGLNEGSFHQLICQRDNHAALVVFDDVPSLTEGQAESFWECVSHLRQNGCEVIACATPICAASLEGSGAWNRVLDQRALLVQCSERNAPSNPLDDAGDEDSCLLRIPALAWGGSSGSSCLVRGFAFDELPIEDALAGLFLLSVGSISATLLDTSGLGIKERIERLRQGYSYFRYRDDCAEYTTVTCDDKMFQHLLLPLISEMISFLEDHEASKYAQALADLLVFADKGYRACKAARALLNPAARKDWLAAQGLMLVFSAGGEAFSEAVESVRRLCPADEEGLASAVILARVLEGVPFDHEAAWRECACESRSLKARCIQGILVLRAAEAVELNVSLKACLQHLRTAVDESAVSSSWQGRLFCFAHDLARGYPAALSSLCSCDCNVVHPHEKLIVALCALWAAEDVSCRSGAWGGGGQSGEAREAREARCEKTQDESSWDERLQGESIQGERLPGEGSQGDKPQNESRRGESTPLRRAQSKSAPARSAQDKNRLVAYLDFLKQQALPSQVVQGIERALRLVSEGHASREASAWDYHTVSIPSLRLNFWGSFSATMGSRVFDARSFKRKKSMTLLALLATERGCDFSRDYLVEALWPDSSLVRARRNFYAVWGDLRQTLRLEDGTCPYLVRSGLSYRLESSLVECDMQEMEELCCCLRDRSASLAQWDQALSALTKRFSGDVLPGVAVNERLDSYNDAAKLGMLDALMVAGWTLFERGESAAALRYARTVLLRAPQREDACELAMKSQMRLGQRTSALNTFLTCQRYLSDQLGLDPSPSVCALYEEALG